MDRPFTANQLRAHRLSLAGKVAAGVLLASGAAWSAQWLLSPSVSRADVRIEVVERGPLEATITAQGFVVPREQQTVSSPVSAEVRTVLVARGERVEHGQPLMQLDTTASKLELSNLEERLALNRAELRSQELTLADSLRQAESRRDLRSIDLESREARFARLAQLADAGIVSEQELLEAELDVKRTRVEIAQIEAEIESLAAPRDADRERLALEHSILDKQRADQARRVALSSVKAPLDGIVTQLIEDAGSTVSIGTPLATIAAEKSFSVDAAVSDFYAPQLATGQRVRVKSSAAELDGHLSRVLPDPDGTRLMLFIELDDPAAPGFHANLRIDAYIVVDERNDVLQLRRGPGLDGAAVEELFVIAGDRAVRRTVRFGMSSNRNLEVVDGLAAGDEVIVSDMAAYGNVSEIRVR
jgi:HlyD family secretion protein